MKTITIKAWQCEGGYRVHYFANTCQVSIGTLMTQIQWMTAVGHPRANMVCTGLEPAAEDESLLTDDLPAIVASETEFDGESGGGVQEGARSFDALMFSLGESFCDIGTLTTATSPHAGNENLGTLGIEGNIERSNAIAAVRRNCAKELGLDPMQIGAVSYRAANLSILKAFSKMIGKINQPF